MHLSRLVGATLAAAVVLGLASGCKDEVPSPTLLLGEEAPDFSLPDVNPNSARYNQLVSPRDYRGVVSGWYFGHST